MLKALDLPSAEGIRRILERIRAYEMKMLILDIVMTPPTTIKNTCFCFQELLGSSKSVLSWQKFDLTAMEDAASVEWKN